MRILALCQGPYGKRIVEHTKKSRPQDCTIEVFSPPGPLRRFYHKVERREGGKVATARKLLEWMYHILKDGKRYKEVEKLAEFIICGEPAKSPGPNDL